MVSSNMAQITSAMQASGKSSKVQGEPIRRVVGRGRPERDPFDLLWELRESARELLGGELPDDTYPDEPIRRTVGKTGAR